LMRLPTRVSLVLLNARVCGRPLRAQLLFYTNDPAVIERGKFHSEFFDEFDLLQHQLLDDKIDDLAALLRRTGRAIERSS